MKTYLLNIPSKKTEEFNWLKPLSNYLLSIYGNITEYEHDLEIFEKLRQDIRGVNAEITGIKLYYRYYSQLELLDLRIPFNLINKHGRLNFTWYDAFDTSKSHKQSALPYEKACILFNLGVLLSKYAIHRYEESLRSSSATSVDDYSKDSIQCFQQAAGVYEFLNENFLHAPSADLNQKTVRFLLKLMLAQSQEVFVLKVISGDTSSTKNSLVAKLCSSTANHYEECSKMISHSRNNDDDVSAIVDEYDEDVEFGEESEEEDDSAKFSLTWHSVIDFKVQFFRSLSFFFNGLALENSKKFGLSIANFVKSSEILNEISALTLKTIAKSGSGDCYELLENYKYQKDSVSIKLEDMEKENDFIYHDIIPTTNSIPDIKPLDSVKIVKMNDNPLFNEINDQNYNNFLNNIIPINIHELLSFYSEEKSQFLRNELDMVEVSNEELSSALEFLQMPEALVSLKEAFYSSKESQPSDIGIDPVLYTYADEVHSGYSMDDNNKNQIEETKKKIYSVVSDYEVQLSNSFLENAFAIKEELIKIKKSLFEAGNSDTKLFGLMSQENAYFYNILRKGPSSSDFKKLFTAPSDIKTNVPELSLLDIDDRVSKDSNSSVENTFKLLEDILHDLNTIKSNKTKLIESLKSDIHKDDISDILILNSKIRSTNEIKTVIFPEELRKFDAYNQKLDELNDKQRAMINDLESNWKYLSGSSKIKEIQASSQFKNSLLKSQTEKLKRFYIDWKNYSEGLSKGVQFYAKLLEYAVAIKSKFLGNANRSSVSSQDSLSQNFSNLNIYRTPTSGSTDYGQQGFFQPRAGGTANRSHSLGNSYGLHQSQQGLFTPTGQGQFGMNYDAQPPQLPPKRPSTDYMKSQFNSQPYNQELQEQGFNAEKSADKKNDLIYNQPSTYQPNMYNFFSNNS